MSEGVPYYPTNPLQWQQWIEARMGITEAEGMKLLQEGNFPIDILESYWNQELTPKNGYSPDFIPALTRNRFGFLRWVYRNDPEPNWIDSEK